MKNRVIFFIGAFLLLLFLLAFSPVVIWAQTPQNVQTLSGSLLKGFHVPSGVTVDATGTGAINATTAATATKLTTARAIYGNNFDGTAALAQIIASTFGGTGNGFTKFSGPAATEKTKTLSNASDTILELAGNYTPTGTWTNLALASPVLSGTLTGSGTIGGSTVINTSGAITGGPGSFTTLAATGSIQLKSTASSNWNIDGAASLSPTAISASGNYDLPPGSGIVLIHDDTNGSLGMFICYAGSIFKINGAADMVVGAPAASQTGFLWTGSLYRITNGYAVSHNYFITTVRTRPTY